VLSELDLYLLGEGTHQRLYDNWAAHPMMLDGVDGVASWCSRRTARVSCRRLQSLGCAAASDAPARRRLLGAVHPHARAGDHYKFDMIGPQGQHLPLKSDPLASSRKCVEDRPRSCSTRSRCLARRPAPSAVNRTQRAMSIYEVHLGSWRRKGNNGG